MTDAIRLCCAVCGSTVTNRLLYVRGVLADSVADGEELVPAGSYTLVRDAILGESQFWNAVPDAFLCRRSDLIGVVENPNFGCCGPDGSGGPDVFCPNGHPVATIFGDCYQAHFAQLSPEHVTIEQGNNRLKEQS